LPVTAQISGEGEVSRPGILRLAVDNPNRALVKLVSLKIHAIEGYQDAKAIHQTIGPLDTETTEIAVEKFPSPSIDDNLPVTGILFYEFEDGVTQECEVKGSIACRQLYTGKRPSLRDRFKP
jgi:hypothetical protein